MGTPKIAIVSFPGSNGEVESMRAIRTAGMEPLFFRWNDDRSLLKDVDGYFIPGGFAYEDRGRSGMVAARDPLMDVIREDAAKGKVVIGICNGAQVLVESGLIPNASGLQMSLARNAIKTDSGMVGLPLLSEWIWITRTCQKEKCATGLWDGVLQIPISHGEGRFTTQDKGLYAELRKNDQIAFCYCNHLGALGTDPEITPNGSEFGIAGICNPEGNVIALMPHPERAQGRGDAYFASMREWILMKRGKPFVQVSRSAATPLGTALSPRKTSLVEVFIDTLIVNNEERTVEQALRRVQPKARLKQWKYFAVPEASLAPLLSDLSVFNARKERATLRRGAALTRWNANDKKEETLVPEAVSEWKSRTIITRRDIPDTQAGAWGNGSESAIAYGLMDTSDTDLLSQSFRDVLGNPHASTLERASV